MRISSSGSFIPNAVVAVRTFRILSPLRVLKAGMVMFKICRGEVVVGFESVQCFIVHLSIHGNDVGVELICVCTVLFAVIGLGVVDGTCLTSLRGQLWRAWYGFFWACSW